MISRMIQRPLAKNTIWMTFGFLGRFGMQLVYFLIVARSLKPEAYGVFSGALAIVFLISPFVTWGSGNILIKHTSLKQNSFPIYWGMAITITFISAFAGLIVSIALGSILFSFSIALTILLPISIGDFFGERFTQLSSQAFQGFQKLSKTSLILMTIGFFRLICALFFFFLPVIKTAENWAIFYMISGLLSGVTGFLFVHKELGKGILSIRPMNGKWLEGFYFSISQSAQGAYNDIDKTLLVRMVSESIAGAYSASYRIMDASFIPIRALVYAGYPRFFQEGHKSIDSARKFAFKLLPYGIFVGFAIGIVLSVFSKYSTVLLGEEYFLTSDIIIWLAPIPLIRVFHYLAADTLTGSGYQGLRSFLQIMIAVFNLCLNLLLIPRFKWFGAVISSLSTEVILAVCLWIPCFLLSDKNQVHEK